MCAGAGASSNAKRVARDDDAERLKVQIDELRSQLHREVEARQAADILKEAAIRSQLELQVLLPLPLPLASTCFHPSLPRWQHAPLHVL